MSENHPSFSDLNYFLTIARAGSLTQAAGVLEVSQSTLSMALNRLEKILAVKLYTRVKDGIQLTRAGHEFVGEARNLIAHWRRVREAATGKGQKLAGHFTVGCSPAAGYIGLASGLRQLTAKYPDITVSFVNTVPVTIVDLVMRGQVDFGLSTWRDPHPSIVCRPLAKIEVGLWQAKMLNIAARGTLIYEQRLTGVEAILKKLKKKRVAFPKSLPCESLELVGGLTAARVGVGIVVKQLVDLLGAANLERIHPEIALKYDLFLLYRKELTHSAAANAFIDVATFR